MKFDPIFKKKRKEETWKKNLTSELNDWWDKFDLVEKILIKDTIINLRDKGISPTKKKKSI